MAINRNLKSVVSSIIKRSDFNLNALFDTVLIVKSPRKWKLTLLHQIIEAGWDDIAMNVMTSYFKEKTKVPFLYHLFENEKTLLEFASYNLVSNLINADVIHANLFLASKSVGMTNRFKLTLLHQIIEAGYEDLALIIISRLSVILIV